ncbi:DsrE family protein [Arcanobacterium hippocoleae]|uniref:Intracellular sulfur oxidation DsrE/DsrF family protein n=1 Tax=Arcanobacterium hippocoleae TaxID=149017 RepID=A0ABU1T383_9ACTO|nr:DsrE family protein [Arcanobacterium hippocoleae]MDR6939837.1 intracellular sulfur oxidation DsrE/DsrF family protein [Arcanobacterium hippocoleae]
MSELKLVFHVNENDRWPFTLRSVGNLIHSAASGKAVVVVNGSAVRSFSQLELEPKLFAKIAALAAAGVRFALCEVALNERQIKRELIPDYVETVPAGIVEIAKLQQSGYGYVKA